MSQTKQTRSLPLGYEGDAPKNATTVYRLNFYDKNRGQVLSNEDRPGGQAVAAPWTARLSKKSYASRWRARRAGVNLRPVRGRRRHMIKATRRACDLLFAGPSTGGTDQFSWDKWDKRFAVDSSRSSLKAQRQSVGFPACQRLFPIKPLPDGKRGPGADCSVVDSTGGS
jgi:hypothetical protein